jgi:prepilin-type processing-associated H-X9-DG protein
MLCLESLPSHVPTRFAVWVDGFTGGVMGGRPHPGGQYSAWFADGSVETRFDHGERIPQTPVQWFNDGDYLVPDQYGTQGGPIAGIWRWIDTGSW